MARRIAGFSDDGLYLRCGGNLDAGDRSAGACHAVRIRRVESQTRDTLADPDGTLSTYTSPVILVHLRCGGEFVDGHRSNQNVTSYQYDALNRKTMEV